MIGWSGRWRRRLRALLRKGELERDMEEEFRFHLEMEAAELARTQGVTAEEAMRRARVAFGGVERFKEEGRDARGVRWLEDLAADLRYALRVYRKSPWAAMVVVATLAMGIGASVLIYCAGRALVFGALAFPAPERLVKVELAGEGGRRRAASYSEFRVWEDGAARAVTLAGHTFEQRFVGDGSSTWQILGSRVTHGFVPVLAVRPLLGRTFTPDDHAPGSEPVAVVTTRLWKGRFGSDPSILGRSIRVDGQAHTIIGVIPAEQTYPAGVDLWTPLPAGETADAGGGTSATGSAAGSAAGGAAGSPIGNTTGAPQGARRGARRGASQGARRGARARGRRGDRQGAQSGARRSTRRPSI